MHKYYRLVVLFLFILALCVCGCSGNGSSADPMGTGTVQFVNEYSTPVQVGAPAPMVVTSLATVQPNSSLTLTVWVSNITSDSKVIPVIGEKVSFTLDSPENGARLTVLNDRTASNGQARVAYTAGNNLFTDVVRVRTGVGATASITITKTGTTTRGAVVSLTPSSPASAAPLGFLTIAATVTDGGVAVQGERVTFALVASNGASLSIQSGLTNAAGQVTTMYLAGNNNIQDVVQASLSNGAKAQVVVTKTGTAPGTSITLSSNPASVSPGTFAIITATVTDSGKNPVSGKLVYFALTTSNGSIDRSELYTDGKGVSSIIYYAWNNIETDILLAWTEGGGYSQLIITKSGQVLGYTATLTANPATFTGTGVGPTWICNTVLTFTVTDSKTSLPAQGMRVRIIPPTVLGVPITSSITPASALTGIDGKASFNVSVVMPAGTIVVDGYVDVNDNGVQDPTEPTAAATLTLTVE